MCTVLLSPGFNPIEVDEYIISVSIGVDGMTAKLLDKMRVL